MPAAEQRNPGASAMPYTVTALGSGSGGTEYELKAVKAFGSGWIVLTSIVQIEGSEPDFSLGWTVLEHARLQQ
jgi:hypothetical protein